MDGSAIELALFVCVALDFGAMMMKRVVFCCWILLVGVSVAQSSDRIAHSLVGTWRLVEYADLDKDGHWQYPYGKEARGYFVYDATGHVHIQIMKMPPLARFAESTSDDDRPLTPEHAQAAYSAYVAYFGTYTVDVAKGIVVHHVEGSLAPDYTGTNQPRPFKLEGDRLEIGDGKTWRRVMERVK